MTSRASELRAMVEGPTAQSRPRVMLVGVFHFADSGADAHKSKYSFDVFSESGQRQLQEVLDRLADFRPTKILVEAESAEQERIDALYARYCADQLAKKSNEIVTVGFALARRLGLEHVYAFDAQGESPATAPQTWDEFLRIAKRMGLESLVSPPIDKRYEDMETRLDEIEEGLSLRQRLLLLNDPDMLRLSNGRYFFWSGFEVADGKEFPGPDGFASSWYNRNLRMFSNIQRLAAPDDRILVIVGHGHVPILQFFAQSCPTMTWTPLSDYLAAR